MPNLYIFFIKLFKAISLLQICWWTVQDQKDGWWPHSGDELWTRSKEKRYMLTLYVTKPINPSIPTPPYIPDHNSTLPTPHLLLIFCSVSLLRVSFLPLCHLSLLTFPSPDQPTSHLSSTLLSLPVSSSPSLLSTFLLPPLFYFNSPIFFSLS